MRRVCGLALRMFEAVAFGLYLVAGAILLRVITFTMTPWMFGPSEDQMAASIIPTMFGVAVGAKTYYWTRRQVISFYQRRQQADVDDRQV